MEQDKISINQKQKVQVNKPKLKKEDIHKKQSLSPHKILRYVSDKNGKLSKQKLANYLKNSDFKKKGIIFKMLSRRYGLKKTREIFEELGENTHFHGKLSERARKRILLKYRKKYYKKAKKFVSTADFESATRAEKDAVPKLGKTIFINRNTGEVIVTKAFTVKQLADFLLKETSLKGAVFVTSDGERIEVEKFPEEVIIPGQKFKVVKSEKVKKKEESAEYKEEIEDKLNEKTDLQAQAVGESYDEVYSIIKGNKAQKEKDDLIKFLEIKYGDTDAESGVNLQRIVLKLPGRKTPVTLFVYDMLNTHIKSFINKTHLPRSVIFKLQKMGKLPEQDKLIRVITDRVVDRETMKRWSKKYEKRSKKIIKKSIDLRVKFFKQNPNLLYQLADDNQINFIQGAPTATKIKVLKTLLNVSNKYERQIRIKIFVSFSPSEFDKFVGVAASEGWLNTFNEKFSGNDYFLYMKFVGDKLKDDPAVGGRPSIVWGGDRATSHILSYGGKTYHTTIRGQKVSIQIGTQGALGDVAEQIDNVYEEFKEVTKESRKNPFGGFLTGVIGFLEKTAVGLLNTLDSPIQTVKNIFNIILSPIKTLKALKAALGEKWDEIREAYNHGMETGDFSRYYELIGELSGEITSVIFSGVKSVKDLSHFLKHVDAKKVRKILEAIKHAGKNLSPKQLGDLLKKMLDKDKENTKKYIEKRLKELKKTKYPQKEKGWMPKDLRNNILKINELKKIKGIRSKIQKGVRVAYVKRKLKSLISKKIGKLSFKGVEAVIYLIEKFGLPQVKFWLKKMFKKGNVSSVNRYLKILVKFKDPKFIAKYIDLYVEDPKNARIKLGLELMKKEEESGKLPMSVLKARAKFKEWITYYDIPEELPFLLSVENGFWTTIKKAKLPKIIRTVIEKKRAEMITKISDKVVDKLYAKYKGDFSIYSREAKRLFIRLFKKEYEVSPKAIHLKVSEFRRYLRKSINRKFR